MPEASHPASPAALAVPSGKGPMGPRQESRSTLRGRLAATSGAPFQIMPNPVGAGTPAADLARRISISSTCPSPSASRAITRMGWRPNRMGTHTVEDPDELPNASDVLAARRNESPPWRPAPGASRKTSNRPEDWMGAGLMASVAGRFRCASRFPTIAQGDVGKSGLAMAPSLIQTLNVSWEVPEPKETLAESANGATRS